MKYSASTVKTATSCTRKWWAERVLKIPVARAQALGFGTVTHACCERVLLGEPPFPPGWTTVKDERGQSSSVDHFEAQMIQELVKAAVDEGVMVPLPAMEVEVGFEFSLPDDLGTFTGRMDLLHAHGVVDNKTIKEKRWALTPKQLADDVQMLCYAKAFFVKFPLMETCELSHRYFCKDPSEPSAFDRRAVVTREAALAAWDARMMPVMRRMHQWASVSDRARWFDVPGPHEDGACRKYGGCPFARVCGRAESIHSLPQPVVTSTQPDQKPMSNRFQRAANGGASPAAPAAAATAPVAPAPQAPAPAATQPDVPDAAPRASGAIVVFPPTPAPWAKADCANCEGRGYTKAGKTCIACAQHYTASHAQGPSDAFRLAYSDNRLTWVHEGKTYQLSVVKVAASRAKLPEAATPSAQPPQETPKAAPRKPAAEPAPTTDEVKQPQAPAPAPQPAAEQPVDAPVPGFVLVIGCALRAPAGQPVCYLEDTFRAYAEQIAADAKAPSFYALDAFKRRDAIAATALAHIRSVPQNAWIVCPARPGLELKALLDAIRPYAAAIVEGGQ